MSPKPKAGAILNKLLAKTRDDELDCDRFFALLAPYLDGTVTEAQLREQIDHHAQMCPECGEELAIMKRALDK